MCDVTQSFLPLKKNFFFAYYLFSFFSDASPSAGTISLGSFTQLVLLNSASTFNQEKLTRSAINTSLRNLISNLKSWLEVPIAYFLDNFFKKEKKTFYFVLGYSRLTML